MFECPVCKRRMRCKIRYDGGIVIRAMTCDWCGYDSGKIREQWSNSVEIKPNPDTHCDIKTD